MDQQQKLNEFVWKQLQNGLDPQAITEQLRGAGWPETAITTAFASAQQQVQPTPVETFASTAPNSEPAIQPQSAPYKKRGRLKTSWQLLKQSVRVLKGNRSLLRYPFMSILISLGLGIIYIAAVLIDNMLGPKLLTYVNYEFDPEGELYLKPLGYLVTFIYYIGAFFITYLYGAGLAAHALDLFRGKQQNYKVYMAQAWKKWPVILAFSTITATVGIILQAIEERFRLFGWIISRVLGLLWQLATAFVVPVIVETDKNAIDSIKQSIHLFKETWGENIITRATLGGAIFLFYLVVVIPIFVLVTIGLVAAFDIVGFFIALGLFFITLIITTTIEVAATNVLNTALYYYAQYRQIPAYFDAELLNSVFMQKKAKK